jgi:S-DNA-T family DNA segregation ATPase FtsK/SpoIIIE
VLFEVAKQKQRKKKMTKKGQEQRISKIAAVLFGLIALYLTIAFVSYFFTWKIDQDAVLQLSWSILFDGSVTVHNWLGRLGAVVSNFFFYWGFGIGSLLFVPFLLHIAYSLIKRIPLRLSLVSYQKGFLGICFIAILASFVFQNFAFPWGGTFGANICFWLANFVGQIGLSILLITSVGIWAIWKFNPALEMINIATPEGMPKIPGFLKFTTALSNKREKVSRSETREDEEEDTDEVATLRPSKKYDEPIIDGHLEFEIEASSRTDARTKPSANGGKERSGELQLELPDTMIGEPSIKQNKPFEEIELEEFGIKPNPNAERIEQKVADSNLEITPKGEKVTPDLRIEEENVENMAPFDPTLELSRYVPPTLELLEEYSDQKFEIDRTELEANKDQIIRSLLNFKIEIVKIRATIGPTVTLYEIVPAAGIKISKIKNLEDDIALSLSALGIRIIAPIPGKGTIGIEVPNKKKQVVSFKEVVRSEKFTNSKMDLPLALGKTISNEVFVVDLAKMPHLLIAGATGQGKSVGINTIISSILYKKHPSQVKLVLIDPKKVELFPYSSIHKHFLAFLPNEDEPIVTETSKAIYTLNSLTMEMDERYDLLKKARARNLKEYNEKFIARKLNPLNGHKFMPFIVLIIDEFADLIMTAGKEVELPIARIAQLARAVGIHCIIATQRPSVNIITGVIKANFPARLAFKVTSKIDSRTILDSGGADQLIGRGDMLLSVGGNIVRLQCAFVDTPEVERIVDHIGNQQGFAEPFYLPEYNGEEGSKDAKSISLSDLDENFWDAAALIVANQHGSTSMLQRKLQLGYNRAGRIMDQLEALGIVGEGRGSKPREVLYFTEMELIELKEKLLNGKM